jgi:hypothetical protein
MNRYPRRATPRLQRLCIAAVIAAIAGNALAEEGGSGHYQVGSMSSFADGVSPSPALIPRLNVVHYSGDFSRGQPLPIAGITAVNISAEATALGFGVAWVPQWGVLNDTWTYQMSITVPLVMPDVKGDVPIQTQQGTVTLRRSDSISALGDIVLLPLMLNQNVSPDFNINYRLGFYAPTGSYQAGRLANAGKNYWTVEPTVGFMYLGQKNGREASVFVGADFNQENPDTHYKTGTQAHVDATFAQHLPLGKGLAGIGLTAYWYEQLAGDSGSGATFGDFKGKTNGIGPVLSYVSQVGGHKLLSEFRWMHEYSVEKRMSGDTLFLKVEAFF